MSDIYEKCIEGEEKILDTGADVTASQEAPKKDKSKKMAPTDEQQLAIDLRDKTLLVSASAGSGKTATLTERIIRSILDTENPTDISGMLIVTFTKTAVADLRSKIERAIKGAISEYTQKLTELKEADTVTEDTAKSIKQAADNVARLEKQLLMLPGARISTIDSFCSDILRVSCDGLPIPPNFRIAEEAEGILIAENTLTALIDGIYSGQITDCITPEELSDLISSTVGVRQTGDEFFGIILSLYNNLGTTVDGIDRLKLFIEDYERVAKSPETSSLWEYIKGRIDGMCNHYLPKIKEHRENIIASTAPNKSVPIKDRTANDIRVLQELLEAKSYSEVHGILKANDIQNNANLGSQPDVVKAVYPLRAHLRAELGGFARSMTELTEVELRELGGRMKDAVTALYKLLKAFDTAFLKEKAERGLCQFNDVLRYTYECLCKDGERTELAYSQAELYDAIYIDEYQDVNGLQDAIFRAISREGNRFMVGDIKQSIYRFRSADPNIFRTMKGSLPALKPAYDENGKYRKYAPEELTESAYALFMSRNFRCDKGIIDFANKIFDPLFSTVKESIGYVEEDNLVFGKGNSTTDYHTPEVVLVDKRYTPCVKTEPELSTLKNATPLVVAQKIREILDEYELNEKGEKLPKFKESDICVIMRNMKGKDVAYAQALASYGIPAVTADEKSFFMNAEILVVLCLLNAIDNPRKDVYLAGLMCSPIFGFSADELAMARMAEGDTLYDSIRNYIKTDEAPKKFKYFLERLDLYRSIAEGTAVDELIARLYHDTNLLTMASTKGKRRRLLTLYEHARRFEEGSFRGLYSFICYLNSILDKKNDFDKRETIPDTEAVRIVTAHSSKGLEYKVVFYVEADQTLNSSREGNAPIIFDNDFGIGMYIRAKSGYALVDNMTRPLVLDYLQRRNVEEDIRILYVALTRAVERLYVVSTPNCKTDEFLKEAEYYRENLDSYSVYNVKNYFSLMLASHDIDYKEPSQFLGTMPEVLLRDTTGIVVPPEEEDDEEDDPEMTEEYTEEKILEVAPHSEELARRFSYKYPFSHATDLPEKLSVSRLYPEVLDGTEEHSGAIDSLKRTANVSFPAKAKKPVFLSTGKKGSPTKKGIATHMLLQFADFENLKSLGAESELEALKEKKFLTDRYAEMVRLDEVEKFRTSRLLDEILSARKVYREQRFNVFLPAENFTTLDTLKESFSRHGEKILVQGVIDCLYEDGDGELHLVDYKTDRLTAEELANPTLAAKKLRDAHTEQLSYYAAAVKEIFGKAPATVRVYSLHLGDEVDIDVSGK